jgi:hypothetical protein
METPKPGLHIGHSPHEQLEFGWLCSKVRTPRQILACLSDYIDQALTCSVLTEGRLSNRSLVSKFAFPVCLPEPFEPLTEPCFFNQP